MHLTPETCPNCEQDLTADRRAGLTYCSRCGSGLATPAPPSADELAPTKRALLRDAFWLLFLAGILITLGFVKSTVDPSTPLKLPQTPAAIAHRQRVVAGISVTLLACSAGGAFCLVQRRVRTESIVVRIALGVAFTLMLLGVHLVILMATFFVGCLLVFRY